MRLDVAEGGSEYKGNDTEPFFGCGTLWLVSSGLIWLAMVREVSNANAIIDIPSTKEEYERCCRGQGHSGGWISENRLAR